MKLYGSNDPGENLYEYGAVEEASVAVSVSTAKTNYCTHFDRIRGRNLFIVFAVLGALFIANKSFYHRSALLSFFNSGPGFGTSDVIKIGQPSSSTSGNIITGINIDSGNGFDNDESSSRGSTLDDYDGDSVHSVTVISSNSSSSGSRTVNLKKSSLRFTLARSGYSPLTYFTDAASKFLKYSFLEDYSAIIEPYAPMSVYFLDDSLASRSGSIYNFSACSVTDGSKCVTGSSLSQPNITVDCKPFDELIVSILFESNNHSIEYSQIYAKCMYVRRDIESLTPEDLALTMDTMYELWKRDEIKGQKHYGSDFHSALYFLEAHFFNSATQPSDHIHEGLGFLPQHIKLSNMFEKSLQSVNPKVTLPYWEFTRDVAQNKTIFESFLFTADTFGTLYKPVDLAWGFTYKNDSISQGKIHNGRWAHITAEKNVRYSNIKSGFGYMKSPWNINPSPYVTRFASTSPSLPTCKQYYSALNEDLTMDFVDNIQKGPHASLHAVVGNVFGCDVLDEMLAKNLIKCTSALLNMCRQWSYYMKDLYRDNYLSPKEGCSADDFDTNPNTINCGYVCNPTQYANMSGAVKELLGQGFVPKSLTSADWNTWTDFICTGNGYKIIVGTHMESSSASDPSFWPMHPTQERLFHARVMASLTETFDWPNDAVNDYVCDTASCYVEAEGTKDYHAICCYGHYAHDQFLDFVTGNTSLTYGPSNYEIMRSSNPLFSDYAMPYIYDDFEYQHCTGAESNVGGLLEAIYIKAGKNQESRAGAEGV